MGLKSSERVCSDGDSPRSGLIVFSPKHDYAFEIKIILIGLFFNRDAYKSQASATERLNAEYVRPEAFVNV